MRIRMDLMLIRRSFAKYVSFLDMEHISAKGSIRILFIGIAEMVLGLDIGQNYKGFFGTSKNKYGRGYGFNNDASFSYVVGR